MIRPLEIDHTYIQVSNLEQTKAHLRAIFDFIYVPHPGFANVVAVENRQIHFFIEESPAPPEFLEKQHLSFEIEDLEAFREKMENLNIPFRSGTVEFFHHKNYRWLEWRDHDGIKWECIQRLYS